MRFAIRSRRLHLTQLLPQTLQSDTQTHRGLYQPAALLRETGMDRSLVLFAIADRTAVFVAFVIHLQFCTTHGANGGLVLNYRLILPDIFLNAQSPHVRPPSRRPSELALLVYPNFHFKPFQPDKIGCQCGGWSLLGETRSRKGEGRRVICRTWQTVHAEGSDSMEAAANKVDGN